MNYFISYSTATKQMPNKKEESRLCIFIEENKIDILSGKSQPIQLWKSKIHTQSVSYDDSNNPKI